jgi:hypothetical protein
MPALTRRRDRNLPQECWRIYYGDVHAGTISQCVGNPGATPKWQWRCGFYPGSRPGECTNGTAATFQAAREAFETAWRIFLAHRTEADFQAWREQQAWTLRSTAALIGANGCRQTKGQCERLPTEAALPRNPRKKLRRDEPREFGQIISPPLFL